MTFSLIVDGLSASYEDSRSRTEVFQGVTFRVEAGEIFGLFGPNGCGKTTLLKVIAGQKLANSGEITLPQKDSVMPSVTTIPQDYRSSFFEWANLQNNLALASGALLTQRRGTLKSIHDYRAELGLDLDLSLRPRECSGGMLQQAAMIRSFLNNTDLILADEPFSALDVNVATTVRTSFRKMVKERGIIAVVVLHQLQDIVDVCDRILVIPGRPFSTEPKLGTHQAVLLKNQMVTDERKNEHNGTFVALAQRLFGGGN